MSTTVLTEGLASLSLDLSADTQQKLLNYIALVQKWNKVYNLTAVRSEDRMLTHHLLDSLAVVPHVASANTLLDAGSGAGLPGIPLALALPQTRVTLLDSNHKKTAFLNQATIELGLNNVEVVCERIEKYQPKQQFSVVVTRAFCDLPMFVALAGRLVASCGMLLAMKGANPVEEIAQINNGDGVFNCTRVMPLDVPGIDAERHLVFLKAA